MNTNRRHEEAGDEVERLAREIGKKVPSDLKARILQKAREIPKEKIAEITPPAQELSRKKTRQRGI